MAGDSVIGSLVLVVEQADADRQARIAGDRSLLADAIDPKRIRFKHGIHYVCRVTP
jgi:hypothetical protein